jgi:hypothetical protein
MNLFSLARQTSADDWNKLKAVLQTEQPVNMKTDEGRSQLHRLTGFLCVIFLSGCATLSQEDCLVAIGLDWVFVMDSPVKPVADCQIT